MMDGFTFPKHAGELEPRLQDEAWCTACVFNLRWPNGFICPNCGTRQPTTKPIKHPLCNRCGKRSSVTAGTLLHGSKKQLGSWLQAIWWLSDNTNPPSIRTVQQQLALPSYQTAWTWMAKLRLAMQLAMRKTCRGTVMVDYAPLSMGPGQTGREVLLAAAESVADGRSLGRIRLACCDDLSPAAIMLFLDNCVHPGSTVVVPDREPLSSVTTLDYFYTINHDTLVVDTIQHLFKQYHAWYSQRHYHASHRAALQACLDEFTFQQNSALQGNRLHIFVHLLAAVLEHKPVPARHLHAAGRTRGGSR